MTADGNILVLTAFSVGFLHTLLGPDHYVPFVAMARSNRWSKRKTLLITSICGAGHIVGSVVIGTFGILLGTVLFQLESIESIRSEGAAWLLIGFGLAYLTWGIIQAWRDVPHSHLHSHADGTVHNHLHKHDLDHRHLHDGVETQKDRVAFKSPSGAAPWILFLIFAFGPCEVLIPLLMYPAAEADLWTIVAVVASFSLATILTMVASVMLIVYGLSLVPVRQLKRINWHRYSQALAGLAVLLCGVLVKFGL